MLLSLNRRDALTARLIGLALVAWSVIHSDEPPALHGRGLVVLVLLIALVAAWLVWTYVTARDQVGRFAGGVLSPELCVLSVTGAFLTAAAPSGAASVATFVAALAAAVRYGLRRALVLVGLAIAVISASAILYHFSALGLLAYALGWSAMALAGGNIRETQMRAEQAELLLAQTQRSHEEQLRVTRLEEQTRIAREIHDVLAHSLAGLTIQLEATAALLGQGADPETIRARIKRAHELARDGLRETRRAVGALRDESAAPAGLAIRALVDGHRSEGDVPLTLTLDCEPLLMGPLGEAVLRVVQEALTNVRKHAPGAAVSVSITSDDSAVVVVVENRLPAPVTAGAPTDLAGSGSGYGLRGMRERAQLLGGTLTAGPVEDGWRVQLRVPLVPGR
jgi:signal transduction histidine kinase